MLYCGMVHALFVSLFSNKILAVMVVIHKLLVRIANRDDPDQIAFSEAVYGNFYKKKIIM